MQSSIMKWRWTALIVYLVICVFDFIVVPIWFGLNRPEYQPFVEQLMTMDQNPMLQIEFMKKLTDHHDPYTLLGGGLFHLAFGALLTGSAFGSQK